MSVFARVVHSRSIHLTLVCVLIPIAWSGCTCANQVSIAPPRVPQGGRAIAIAVSQDDGKHIVVATESGGLFRTFDGGVSFQHLDQFPTFAPLDVAIASLDHNVLIATARDDFRTTSGGGIWRSADGGGSWTRPAGWPPPTSPTCPPRPVARGISHMPLSRTFYVATDCGIAVSTDNGASFSMVVLDPTTPAVQGVMVLNRSTGVASDARRLWFMNGGPWQPSTGGPTTGGDGSIHIFASPWWATSSIFYHVGRDRLLYFSMDAGATWTEMPTKPHGDGREEIVRVARGLDQDPTHIDIYFADGFALWREAVTVSVPGGHVDDWRELQSDHRDPGDVGFSPGFELPIMEASDGGVHLNTGSPFSTDFFLTQNTGTSWTKSFSLPFATLGRVQFAGNLADPVAYVAVKRPGVIGLFRAQNIATQPVARAADSVNLSSLGLLRTFQASYGAFGVDPSSPDHLLAADAGDSTMKASVDGGLHWFPVPALTTAVSDSGRFFVAKGGSSFATTIAWDPTNSCHILVGTMQNGVIRSIDGGQTWTRIAGSPVITYVSSFFFPPTGSIWTSAYGRGLWTLNVDRSKPANGRCAFPQPPKTIPPSKTVDSAALARARDRSAPRLQLMSAGTSRNPSVVVLGDSIDVYGYGFAPGAGVTIVIGADTVGRGVSVLGNGSFVARVRAVGGPGQLVVSAVQRGTRVEGSITVAAPGEK